VLILPILSVILDTRVAGHTGISFFWGVVTGFVFICGLPDVYIKKPPK